MTRRWLLGVLLLAACGAKAPVDPCATACDHIIGLSMIDVAEPGLAQTLRSEAARATGSERSRCVAACRRGEVEPRCVLAATTLVDALACHRRGD